MDKKRTKKGFTLIELIIVMAVFTILMIAVMSIVTPLNKIVKKASIQEANSAAVDNVKRYMENTLRYSDCIEVYVGDLVDFNGNTLAAPVGLDRESFAARNFIENHYMNRTNPGTEDPLTGKVRMLKVDNSDGGRITEYEWDFKSGYTYIQFDGSGNKKQVQDTGPAGNLLYDALGNPIMIDDYGIEHASLTNMTVNKNVINPVYFEDYSFYFQPGYNTTELTTDTSVINSLFDTSKDKPDVYYSSIVPVEMPSGAKSPDFSPSLFSLTVMTYKKDGAYGEIADDPTTPGVDESLTIFRSPFAISNVNMSLVNINSSFSSNKAGDKYGPVRWNGKPTGYPSNYTPTDKVDVVAPKDGIWDYEEINANQAALISKRFYSYPKTSGDCIYFVYTLPDME